jgi:MFS family permease
MAIGAILQASSFGRIQLIVARVVTGIGNGLNTCTIPMWQAETLPARNRGAFLNLQAV